jgi:hypothetical protein
VNHNHDVAFAFAAGLGDVLDELVTAFLEVKVVAIAADICNR